MTPSRQRDVRILTVHVTGRAPIGDHAHPAHQLVRVDQGALAFTHREAAWVVPVGGSVWLPAGLGHRLDAVTDTDATVLYLRARAGDVVPPPGPVDISPLLAELVAVLSHPVPDPARRANLEAVVRDEVRTMVPRPFVVALPLDPGARAVAEAVLAAPTEEAPLAELAERAGASVRTVQRRFREETGLSFRSWRRRAGLQHAMAALERGGTISAVAHECGFASASAFIAAFRAELGVTPAAWRRRAI